MSYLVHGGFNAAKNVLASVSYEIVGLGLGFVLEFKCQTLNYNFKRYVPNIVTVNHVM
jgi:hypothetical protein